MGLTSPLSEIDAELWTVRFLAHAFLGLVAWHSLFMATGPIHATWSVPLVYLVGWEMAVQKVGAGWWDAIADSLAVGLGGLMSLAIMALHITNSAWPMVGALALGIASLAYGVRKRT